MCFPGASVSASNVVTLKLTDQVDLAEINSAQDCIAAAAEPDVVSLFEEVVNHWCKQVAQVPVFDVYCRVSARPGKL